ncbi:MAG: hypothetical protein JXB32_07455 [Deltaproteobacteria bacterium]|nr:hypothetical protein [Deltaproteobacteria bacterium]
MGIRRSAWFRFGRARATALGAVCLLLLAAPARADIVSCWLSAEPEGTSVRIELSMTPSASGMVPMFCPPESVLRRIDGTGTSEYLSVDWSPGCAGPWSSGSTCCGSFIDECTPPGSLGYYFASGCGSGYLHGDTVDRGRDVCPEPEPEAGCGCATAGGGRRAVALALFGALLVVGLAAWRRDRA